MGQSPVDIRPEQGLLKIRKELIFMQIYVQSTYYSSLSDASPLKKRNH